MFDYMIRKLPNGRLLVRDLASKESKVLRADQVSSYFEDTLQSELEAQNELDDQVAAIKEQVGENIDE